MKWLIIFPDPWISYSPSILNFIKMLELYKQEYLLVYLNTDEFDNSKIKINGLEININSRLVKFLKKIKLYRIYFYLKFFFGIRKNVQKHEFDKVVGVDNIGYSIARFLHPSPIYYSLEVSQDWLNKIIFNSYKPSILIIQSKERKEYLASDFNNVIYIQNSPISQKNIQEIKVYKGRLIYFGNIIESHGVEICLNALYKLKNETLMIKGTGRETYVSFLKNKYKDLFNQGRVCIDTEYINQDSIYEFLKDFDIGFCFYDMNIIGYKNFNYLSSPSGKIFNYLMCAIPVIGSKIVGLDIIEENKAGILLSEIKVDNIVKALNDIELNYHTFVENAYQVSCNFDYAKMFASNWDRLSDTEETL